MAPPSAEKRQCLECGAQETPLWRGGPLGPKTLCNACGVRWKKHNPTLTVAAAQAQTAAAAAQTSRHSPTLSPTAASPANSARPAAHSPGPPHHRSAKPVVKKDRPAPRATLAHRKNTHALSASDASKNLPSIKKYATAPASDSDFDSAEHPDPPPLPQLSGIIDEFDDSDWVLPRALSRPKGDPTALLGHYVRSTILCTSNSVCPTYSGFLSGLMASNSFRSSPPSTPARKSMSLSDWS